MKLTKKGSSKLGGEALEESAKKPEKKSIDPRFLGAALGLLLGVLLSIFVSFLLFDSQVTKAQEKQLLELTQQKADLAAGALQSYFREVGDKAEFFATRPYLREAILNNDLAELIQVKRTVQRQINDVESVQILAVGEAQLDSERQPPIRFSELALIQSAEKGEQAKVEATKVDGRWLLHFVLPARESADADVDGVMWISTNVQALKALLLKDSEGLGKVELFQKFGANSRPLVASVGAADLDFVASAQIDGSQWEVQFTAASTLKAMTHVNALFIYIFMLVIMILFAAAFSALGFFSATKISGLLSKTPSGQPGAAPGEVSGDGLVDPMYQTKSLFDVDIVKEDEGLLGMDDDEPETEVEETLTLDDDVFEIDGIEELDGGFPEEVFRAYDIRGVADEQIDNEFALCLGKALGSELLEQREGTLVVARDARTHSPHLTEWLVRGVLSTGCNVLNIGTVPTPLMYFAIETLEEVTSGVMVTASHNAAKYNGFKLVINCVSRSGEDIQGVRRRMNGKKFLQGQGKEHHHDVVPSYIDAIFSDVALAGELSVVIDAGNGVAGKVAPKLFEELGCRVTPLYCDLDGHFPNHDPDPSVEANLKDLIAKVSESDADIGIALDGDGDRLAVVSRSGKIYTADRLLMLFATDIISRSPGADVVFDVKSTRHLNACIANAGGRPIMWKTGHSLMKQKMIETGAVVGAEYSGHIFIKDRWFGFDDGMYAAARLLEILSLQGEDIDEAFAMYAESVSTPEIRIPIAEGRKFEIIEELKAKGEFGEGRLTLLDGLRADYSFGWGLVRASNTGAELTLRFEADDDDSLHKLKSIFVKELRAIDSSIEVNWNQ